MHERITFCRQPATVACDENCDKAWGINSRPQRYLSGDPSEPGISDREQDRRHDDYVYLADGDLGVAPSNPGTSEGFQYKPGPDEPKPNKWCVRECERCYMSDPGREDDPPVLPDLENPRPNMGWRSKGDAPNQDVPATDATGTSGGEMVTPGEGRTTLAGSVPREGDNG